MLQRRPDVIPRPACPLRRLGPEAKGDPRPVLLQAGGGRLGPVRDHGGVVKAKSPCCVAAAVDLPGMRCCQGVGRVLCRGVDDGDPQHHVVYSGDDDDSSSSPGSPEDVVAAYAEVEVVQLHHVLEVGPGQGEQAPVPEDALPVPFLAEHPAGLAVLHGSHIDVPGKKMHILARPRHQGWEFGGNAALPGSSAQHCKKIYIVKSNQSDVLVLGE